jgi:hypothetical protein
MEIAEAMILPKLQSIRFSIEILAVPGRPIPTAKTLHTILNENLEPHLDFKVRSRYASRQNRKNE